MIRFKRTLIYVACVAFLLPATSCSKKSKSGKTGWAYNDPKNGGFIKYNYKGQETGPGLVLIEGGTFTMGSSEQDVLFDRNNIERRVTVNSFYMDETEVSNLDYLEYLWWLRRAYVDFPEVHNDALPDTLVWRDKLAFNEPFVEYYFRHPSYQDYPVVGVSWVEATNYAAWRTDRVNEQILVREGIIKWDLTQNGEQTFNTQAYLAGAYEPAKKGKKQVKDILTKKPRSVWMEDGILLPEYRLPTEAEWEYAALAHVGNSIYENVNNKRLYPWDGHTIRQDEPEKHRGELMANFKRDRGDNAGIAGKLNDKGFITTPVKSYWPNDYGLYNMGGNVSEWVMDIYRPLTMEDFADFQSFRGNVFKKRKLDADQMVVKDSMGRLVYEDVTLDENKDRRNYKVADNIGYLDELSYNGGEQQYEYGVTSLIDNRARVIKGGSWNDRAYWMSPGTRRFLDEKQSTSWLGFRCSMIRLGAPTGNNGKFEAYLKSPVSLKARRGFFLQFPMQQKGPDTFSAQI